jgi:hypothetical protein
LEDSGATDAPGPVERSGSTDASGVVQRSGSIEGTHRAEQRPDRPETAPREHETERHEQGAVAGGEGVPAVTSNGNGATPDPDSPGATPDPVTAVETTARESSGAEDERP